MNRPDRGRDRAPARSARQRAQPQSPASEGVEPEVVRQQEVIFRYEGYSGPVPPPEMVERYQTVIPSGGERLLAMAEDESRHRRDMERRQLRASVATHALGQVLGFILALAVILAGVWLIDRDHSLAGFATLLVGAAGLIRAVVVARQ